MNKKVFAVLHCIYLCCSAPIRGCGNSLTRPGRDGRLIGGEETRRGDYPWMVSLQTVSDNDHFCAGSVISERWIITAAHCIDNISNQPSFIQGVVGLYKQSEISYSTVQIHKISKIVRHENFTSETAENDIALLKTDQPIYGPWGDMYEICLPERDSEPSGYAKVIGWGKVSYPAGAYSDVLLQVIVPIIPMETCKESYGKTPEGIDYVYPNMMCAGTELKDACSEDSGGPLFRTDRGISTIIGIVSFGIGCASRKYPGVYTKVSAYIPWIETTIEKD